MSTDEDTNTPGDIEVFLQHKKEFLEKTGIDPTLLDFRREYWGYGRRPVLAVIFPNDLKIAYSWGSFYIVSIAGLDVNPPNTTRGDVSVDTIQRLAIDYSVRMEYAAIIREKYKKIEELGTKINRCMNL